MFEIPRFKMKKNDKLYHLMYTISGQEYLSVCLLFKAGKQPNFGEKT